MREMIHVCICVYILLMKCLGIFLSNISREFICNDEIFIVEREIWSDNIFSKSFFHYLAFNIRYFIKPTVYDYGIEFQMLSRWYSNRNSRV